MATEAAVSRQTVYRQFASRDELLLTALLRALERAEAEHPLAVVPEEVRSPQDVAALVVESVVRTIETIRTTPKLSHLLTSEADSVRATISGASEALFAYHEDVLRPWLEAARDAGLIREGLELRETAEWILRTGLSLLTVEGPVERDAEALRRYLTTYLVPALLPEERPAGAPSPDPDPEEGP